VPLLSKTVAADAAVAEDNKRERELIFDQFAVGATYMLLLDIFMSIHRQRRHGLRCP
jgi:hypothetical protein